MRYRDAKRLAWKLAVEILASSRPPEGFTDNSYDQRRFERAWLEVLMVANRRGGSVYDVKLLASLDDEFGAGDTEP